MPLGATSRVLKKNTFNLNKLAISGISKIDFIDKDKIIFCEAKSNYTTVVTDDGQKYTLCKCLKHVVKELKAHYFFRCHASFVVNLRYLDSIHTGSVKYLIASGQSIPISRNKFGELKEHLGL